MLNRKGAMSRQRGSMVLMVIFVMILFGFLSASLVRFSVDQNTGASTTAGTLKLLTQTATRTATGLRTSTLTDSGRAVKGSLWGSGISSRFPMAPVSRAAVSHLSAGRERPQAAACTI